jgi:hypothetical protein
MTSQSASGNRNDVLGAFRFGKEADLFGDVRARPRGRRADDDELAAGAEVAPNGALVLSAREVFLVAEDVQVAIGKAKLARRTISLEGRLECDREDAIHA